MRWPRTSSSLMPVISVICGGMGLPGSSNASNTVTGPTGKPVAVSTKTESMASSMTRSWRQSKPVVSVSSTNTRCVFAPAGTGP